MICWNTILVFMVGGTFLSMGSFYRTIIGSDGFIGAALVEYIKHGVLYGQCEYDNPSGEEIKVYYEEYPDSIRAVTNYDQNSDPGFHFKECRAHAERFSDPKLRENPKFRQASIPESIEERQARYHTLVRRFQSIQQNLFTSFSIGSGTTIYTSSFFNDWVNKTLIIVG